MAITWETLLRRRGIASLTEYAGSRGITSYDQLCESFRAHGLAPPSRHEAADFLSAPTVPEKKEPDPTPQAPPAFDEPVADILYEAPKPAKKKSKKKRGK